MRVLVCVCVRLCLCVRVFVCVLVCECVFVCEFFFFWVREGGSRQERDRGYQASDESVIWT